MSILREKLEKMTGKDVVLAMVKGLKEQHVRVDMETFGKIKEGICYGCAATNTICEITNKTLSDDDLSLSDHDQFGYIGMCAKERIFSSDFHCIDEFECAVDQLRLGKIDTYNFYITKLDLRNLILPELGLHERQLPSLRDDNWKRGLQEYIDYANSL